MVSLKSFYPELSQLLPMSPDELYNRQRAMVGCGVLPSIVGKGPGSGVHLSERSVAILLIGILSAKTLGETDARIKSICSAKPEDPYFTAEKMLKLDFCEALTDFFRGKLSYVSHVSVSPWHSAEIVRSQGKPRVLLFSTRHPDDSGVIQDIRLIGGLHLDRIRYALQDRLLKSGGSE